MIFRREGDVSTSGSSSGGGVSRIIGGSPLGVIVRLALLCVIVGLVLDQLDLNVFKLLNQAIDLIEELIRNSADVLKQIGRYFLIGAMVVIPIWIVLRILRVGAGRR